MIDRSSVAEVLAFARAGEERKYDEIGARMNAISALAGPSPLQTLRPAVVSAQARGSDRAERLAKLRQEVRHLSFALKPPDGPVKFEMTEREACYRWEQGGRTVERRLSLADPPAFLLESSRDRDAAPLRAQSEHGDVPDIWWLPFFELLEAGRFVRMQEGHERLSNAFDPTCYYAFVSHRWLTPNQPDPSGLQAALVGWQILGHLVSAIWVGAARGRHIARKTADMGQVFVGPHGSEFAESIVVNLLRPLSDDRFADLVREAAKFDDLDDCGVSLAQSDVGLGTLQARLMETPHLRAALGQFRVWYDYSCMPQHERTPDEQSRFESLLRRLGAIQALGRTLVLLDGVEDYLGRAWCTYEAVLSTEHLNHAMDALDGAESPGEDFSARKALLMQVLTDRPHLVWRGILDTEVFGVQSSAECMSRLGLATTRPEDLETVYGLIRALGAPRSVHYDEGEIVTGVFPLALRAGQAAVVTWIGRSLDRRESAVPSVSTEGADSLVQVGPGGLPPLEEFAAAEGVVGRSAHVAIFGRCEGEAILYAHWVTIHRAELEEALGISVRSLSWVSSDIAPVGHLAVGALTIRGIEADVWVVAGAASNLGGGNTPRMLTETLWAIGIECLELDLDEAKNNVRRYCPPVGGATAEHHQDLRWLGPEHPGFTTFPGGLFRSQILQNLGGRP